MRVLSLILFLQAAALPAGTLLKAKLQTAVQTATSNSGDPVVAIVTEPLMLAGSQLNGRVETIEAASQTSEGRVRLVFREIQFPDGRRVSTWITNSFSASAPKRKLRYVVYIGGGTAAGGLIGGKSARVAGIIGGALVGFIIASNTAIGSLPDLSLKPGETLRLQLGEDLKL